MGAPYGASTANLLEDESSDEDDAKTGLGKERVSLTYWRSSALGSHIYFLSYFAN